MRGGILRGGLLLSVGQAVTLVSSFVRNLIIARLVGPENMGIAAGFLAMTSAVELTTNVGLEKVVIQDDDADQPDFLGSAHSILAIRSLLLAVVTYLLAAPCAAWFDASEAVNAFRALALYPLLKGLTHLDVSRIQRSFQFRPHVTVTIGSHLMATVVGITTALWLRSYWAVLLAMLTQVSVALVLSHLVTKEKYRFHWNRTFVHRMLVYGWPLSVSGGLMWFGLYSDRFIIGRAYDLATLGNYAVVYALANVPMLGITSVLNGIVLPVLSQAKSDPDVLHRHFRKTAYTTAVCAGCLALVFVIVGPQCVLLCYGSDYSQAAQWAGLMGLLNAVRLFRIVPNQAALALGTTRVIMGSNIVRTITVPLIAWAAFSGYTIGFVLLLICLSDVVALVSSIIMLDLSYSGLGKVLCGPLGLATSLVGSAFVLSELIIPGQSLSIRITILLGLIGLVFYRLVAVEFRNDYAKLKQRVMSR